MSLQVAEDTELFQNILSIATVIVTKIKRRPCQSTPVEIFGFLEPDNSDFCSESSEVLHLGNIKFDAPPNNSEGQKLSRDERENLEKTNSKKETEVR